MSFPPCPAEIRPVQHILKLADEHESRNIVVSYWARMYAVQFALKLTEGKQRSPEVTALITALLNWLEQTKKENLDNEGIKSETTGHAMLEEYALQLFDKAEALDHAEQFDKNLVKLFYTCGILMDVLEQFGLSEDFVVKRKYAKWKAANIHNCLKNGERPMPGRYSSDDSNVAHISELTDEERAAALAEHKRMEEEREAELRRMSEARRKEEEDNNSYDPPSDNLTPAPAPNPSPITPVTPSLPQPVVNPAAQNRNAANLQPDQIQKAQKYCKYATSALNYDDVTTAIANLTKALNLLTTGSDQ